MILGITTTGEYAIGDLPSAWDLSVASPLRGLLADPLLPRVYLLVATPWNPVTRSAVTVYLANGAYQTEPTDTPANQLFIPALRSPYNCQFTLWSGTFSSRSTPGYGDVQIINNDGSLDALTTYSWAGCDIRVLLGSPSDPYSLFSTIFHGTAAGLTWDSQYINVQLADLQQLLAKPLQANLFTPSALYFGGAAYAATTVPFVQPAGPLAYECWVRPDAVTAAQYDLLGVRNGTAAGLRRLDLSGGNLPRFSVRNDAGALFSAQWGTAVPALSWHHIAGVLDTAGGFIYLYVDRVLRASMAITGAFTTALSNFTLGRTPDVAGNYFAGRLGEIRVWSAARTLTQIGTNMYLTFAGTEAGLSAYYYCAEGKGSTAADSTAGAHILTLSGASWASGDWQPTAIVGKPKPLSYGQVRQRPATLVDANAPGQLVYQLHDRTMQAVNTLFDSCAPLVLGTDYTVDLSRGYAFLLHSPVGAITADVQGDNGGSGYVLTAADITRRIATRHGGLADPSQINTDSFNVANAANSAVVGYATDEQAQVQITDALSEVMYSVSGKWAIDRLGLLFVAVFAAPTTAVKSITEGDIVWDAASGAHIHRLATTDPSVRQRVGYHRIWLTQPPANIAATVSDTDKATFGQPYAFAAQGEDLSVLDGYPLAQTVETLTLLDDAAAASAESIRRQTLFGQRQDIYQVELAIGLFTYWLNDTVSLTLSGERPDLPAGTLRTRWDLNIRAGVVIAIAEEVSTDLGVADKVTLTIWCPEAPAQLLVDSVTGDPLLIDTTTGDGLLV